MGGCSINTQIRRLRRDRGWSLADLARRAGTSSATLSRYENGWDRFEVATLRKLAGALGCRLQITFEDLTAGRQTLDAEQVAKRLARLFWDRPLRASVLEAHPQWVLERVLDFGALDDVHVLVDFFGRRDFLERVRRARFGSPRTATFWQGILEMEGTTCTRRYSRPVAWNS